MSLPKIKEYPAVTSIVLLPLIGGSLFMTSQDFVVLTLDKLLEVLKIFPESEF